jgi:hypothetical protein
LRPRQDPGMPWLVCLLQVRAQCRGWAWPQRACGWCRVVLPHVHATLSSRTRTPPHPPPPTHPHTHTHHARAASKTTTACARRRAAAL